MAAMKEPHPGMRRVQGPVEAIYCTKCGERLSSTIAEPNPPAYNAFTGRLMVEIYRACPNYRRHFGVFENGHDRFYVGFRDATD